jgi:hypothetical protein
MTRFIVSAYGLGEFAWGPTPESAHSQAELVVGLIAWERAKAPDGVPAYVPAVGVTVDDDLVGMRRVDMRAAP